MIPTQIKERLLKNWGTLADAMDCYAEVCFYHSDDRWRCYVFAINPVNDDSIQCIITDGDYCEIAEWSLERLRTFFDKHGEFPAIDPEFRRIKVDVLWKKLKEYHGTIRDKRTTG